MLLELAQTTSKSGSGCRASVYTRQTPFEKGACLTNLKAAYPTSTFHIPVLLLHLEVELAMFH